MNRSRGARIGARATVEGKAIVKNFPGAISRRQRRWAPGLAGGSTRHTSVLTSAQRAHAAARARNDNAVAGIPTSNGVTSDQKRRANLLEST
jgi:hypothetical protein